MLTCSPLCILQHNCEHRRYILGVTSLWLLVPIATSILNYSHKYSWPQIALLSWTSMTCVVSTLFWPSLGTPRGPLLYRLDKIFAYIQFISLIVFFICDQSPRLFSIHYAVTFPLVIVVCFAFSRFFEVVWPHDLMASISHLMFRFIGYWWTYLALTACRLTVGTVASNSVLYWGHIIYALMRTGMHDQFRARNISEYCRGCVEVIALSTCVIASHYMIV